MAWTEAARRAAANARKKGKIGVGPNRQISRTAKARALKAARKEYGGGKSLLQMRAGSIAAGLLERGTSGSKGAMLGRKNAYARQAWRSFVPESSISHRFEVRRPEGSRGRDPTPPLGPGKRAFRRRGF